MPGENGALAGALFGLGDGGGRACARRAGASPAGRRLAFRRRRPPSRNSRRSAWRSAAMSSPATARSRARRCASRLPAGVDAARVRAHRRRRLPGARSGQHADQRHGAGRAGEGGARPWPRHTRPRSRSSRATICSTQNFPMIHAVGRASAGAPRLIDMSWGNEGRAEGDAGRQGRLLRHRRPRHQAVVRHAADEEGHGRRGQCAGPGLDDHGRRAEGAAARADPGGRELDRRQRLPAGRRAARAARASPSRSATPTPRAGWSWPMRWRWPTRRSRSC